MRIQEQGGDVLKLLFRDRKRTSVVLHLTS